MLPGMAYGYVLRSPHAHAKVLAVRTDKAKAAPGVLAVLTGADAVADVLFAMADGVAMRMLTERDRDFGPSVAAGVLAVRALMD